MYSGRQYADPFVLPDALADLMPAAPEFDLLASLTTGDLNHAPLSEPLEKIVLKPLEAPALALGDIDLRPLAHLESATDSSGASLSDLTELPQDENCAFWLSDEVSRHSTLRLRSWEQFANSQSCISRGLFLSDKPSHVFDYMIGLEVEPSETLLSTRLLLSCLTQLGLGRESLLFQFDVKEKSFAISTEHVRPSGYSGETCGSFVGAMIQIGNEVREMRSLCYSDAASTTSIAVLGEVQNVLLAIEERFVSPSPLPITLLQLQAAFEEPRQLVKETLQTLKSATSPDMEMTLLSDITRKIRLAEEQNCYSQLFHLRLLEVASRPWLEKVGNWIGLPSVQARISSPPPTFVSPDLLDSSSMSVQFNPLGLPDFMTKHMGLLAFETGLAFRLLASYSPNNPLVKYRDQSIESWGLQEWDVRWQSLEENSAAAHDYERRLQEVVAEYKLHERIDGWSDSSSPRCSDQAALAKSQISITTPGGELLPSLPELREPSYMDVSHIQPAESPMRPFGDSPETSMVPILRIQPWIIAQSRLVNSECLGMLYSKFDIQAHIQILIRFFLLRDGPFTSRLSQALFDPNLQSSERRRGRQWTGTLGLQLGNRTTWPPAVSELRLALMGILTDSYFSLSNLEQRSLFREELPGNLSFAVREMTDSNLQKCLDQDSFFALDFLQLQYRASPPLDSIITPKALRKYDMLFRFLLRLQRMMYVVSRLSQPSRGSTNIKSSFNGSWLRFCHMSRHLVSVVNLSFSQSMARASSIITARFQQVKTRMDNGNIDAGDSISQLREWHEDTLNDALSALLLRKKQAHIMELLEDVFGTILNTSSHPDAASLDEDRSQLHATIGRLAEKISRFTRACQDATDLKGNPSNYIPGKPSRDSSYQSMSDLLLNLNMNQCYAR